MSIDDATPEDWNRLKTDAKAIEDAKVIYAKMAEDMVNHPPHYSGDIECIDALQSHLTRDEFIGWLRGNAVKYLWRLRSKDNPKQDCEKCMFFLKKLKSII